MSGPDSLWILWNDLNQMAIKPTLQQIDAILEVFNNHRVVFCALKQLSCIEMYLLVRTVDLLVICLMLDASKAFDRVQLC